MTEFFDKPKGLKDDHLEWLDDFRESGHHNMYDAPRFIMAHFGLNKQDAFKYVEYWMATYKDRHVKKGIEKLTSAYKELKAKEENNE